MKLQHTFDSLANLSFQHKNFTVQFSESESGELNFQIRGDQKLDIFSLNRIYNEVIPVLKKKLRPLGYGINSKLIVSHEGVTVFITSSKFFGLLANLLDGFASPKEYINRAKGLLDHADHSTVSEAIHLLQALETSRSHLARESTR
tara:strand:- start:5253 stop:5690 length:438 start_codon:yes stop_codon:yes gene_type:complete